MEENVNINVTDNADEAAAGFKNLRTQIRETTIALQELEAQGQTNTDEFRRLRTQLDDLNDTQDRVRFRAGQLDDQLAALPGPIGQAGQAFKGFNDALKLLLTNPVFLVIAAAVGVFLLFKKAMESTAEGQATLNKVSTAFSKILGPILAIVEKVALPLFNRFADLLILVADGFEWFALKIGIAQSKIDEASSGTEDFAKSAEEKAKLQKAAADKAQAAAEKYAEEVKKSNEIIRQAELAFMTAKDRELEEARKKHEENMIQLRKTGGRGIAIETERYLKDVRAIEKKYSDEAFNNYVKGLNAVDAEQAKIDSIDIERRRKDNTLKEDDELAHQRELNRIAFQALLVRQSDEMNALKAKKSELVDFNQQELNLKNLHKKQLDVQWKEQNDSLAKISENYRAFEIQKQNDLNQDVIDNLDDLNTQKQNDYQADVDRINLQQEALDTWYTYQLNAKKYTTEELYKLDREYFKKKQQLDKAGEKAENDRIQANFKAVTATADALSYLGNSIASIYDQEAEKSAQAFETRKSFLKASAIIAGASGIVQILSQPSTLPSPFDWITKGINAAALAVAVGVQVDKIGTAQFGGGGSGGAGSTGLGGLGSPSVSGPNVNLYTATQQGTSANIVAGTILANQSQDRPIKVFVTANDVTTTQQLARKTQQLARLG